MILAVSEGDSWFQHPRIRDVIDQLTRYDKFDKLAVKSLGAAGDEIWQMLRKDELRRHVASENAHVALISAGGNDILGPGFRDFIHKYTKGEDIKRLINLKKLDNKLGLIKTYYRDFLEGLKKANKKTDSNLKVIGHTYAYAGLKKGGWLSKPMNAKEIPPDDQRKAIIEIVNRFHDRVLKPLQDKEYEGFFFYADVRDDLLNEDDWKDEIHPSNMGFFHVAYKIYTRMVEAIS